ncbi:hypothetical protein RB595_006657 [Gaeumannomyces hyphopodioides]
MAATCQPVILTPGMCIGGPELTPVVVPNRALDAKDEGEWPSDVEKVPIPFFDSGVFITELINNNMLPKKFSGGLTDDEKAASRSNPESMLERAQHDKDAIKNLDQGTYRGTQLALTKAYNLIETKYTSFMDAANFEPTVPSPLSLEQKRQFFKFTMPADQPSTTGNQTVDDADNYPPHLNLGAKTALAPGQPGGTAANFGLSMGSADIFNKMRLAQLSTLLPSIVPGSFLENLAQKAVQGAAVAAYGSMGTPDKGAKIADVENYNNREHNKLWYQKDIFDLKNIGNLPDWYSDARFAQQFFTGGDPSSITKAGKWTQIFIDAATDPADAAMKAKIQARADSLYVQDYSYFRSVAGYEPKAEMSAEPKLGGKERARRWTVASVCLLNLADDGKLEPLAIIIDWLGSAEESVVIYNKELSPTRQKEDWPWRYAKTCVMSSDWVRHNVTVHLCRTHLIEESVIVAANRTIPQDHDVYQLLYPHWQKTLSLNAAARTTLVPLVVAPLLGMEPNHVYKYLLSEYRSYDFEGSYIPADLAARGFPVDRLGDKKYHNYAWARCIHSMWLKLRAFVADMLALRYTGPDPHAQVRADDAVQAWSREMRAPTAADGSGAGISSFPELKTLDSLVDAVTMCIHIASPQHTSVNYLQNYYQAFVVNKPPALFRPPPRARAELAGYGEDELVAALPMNQTHDWLMASHIPYLLSAKPGDKESLIIYAASKYHVYKLKTDGKGRDIARAAAKFYTSLAESEQEFRGYGQDTDDNDTIVYDVLSPSWNAVSILI